MAVISKTLLEKKVDLSEFFEEGDYVTIKKIPRSEIVKSDLYYQNSIEMFSMIGISSMFAEKLRSAGGDDINKLDDDEKKEVIDQISAEVQQELYKQMQENLQKKTESEIDAMAESSKMADAILLVNGVDSMKHSFFDENGNKISLTADIITTAFEKKAVDKIIKEIRDFNTGKKSLK